MKIFSAYIGRTGRDALTRLFQGFFQDFDIFQLSFAAIVFFKGLLNIKDKNNTFQLI